MVIRASGVSDHRLSGAVKPDARIEVFFYDSTAPVFTLLPFINK